MAKEAHVWEKSSMTIAYRDTDKCTDTILDFIAQLESAGNYNAVIGNARAIDDLGRVLLIRFTN